MNALTHYPSSELKLVYRVLHSSLMKHIDLMDSELLNDLQTLLRERATADGVDTSDHGAWDAWLGAAPTEPAPPSSPRFTLMDGGKA